MIPSPPARGGTKLSLFPFYNFGSETQIKHLSCGNRPQSKNRGNLKLFAFVEYTMRTDLRFLETSSGSSFLISDYYDLFP